MKIIFFLAIVIIGIAGFILLTGKIKSISKEYEHISSELGTKGKDWELLRQALVADKEGKRYDMLTVKITATGEEKNYQFEIK